MNRISSFPFLAALAACAVASAQGPPAISTGGAVNAADYSREFAPGAVVSLFGSNFASRLVGAPAIPLPTVLDGVSLEVITGASTVLAPLYAVAPGQINAILPYNVSGDIQLRVRNAAGAGNSITISLKSSAPRLFSVDLTGHGRAILTHPDGAYASRERPARPGDIVVLYANSMGPVDPPISAGLAGGAGGPGDPLNRLTEPVTVAIDGAPARTEYAGLAPYFSGLYQLNLRLPYWDVIGDLPIVARVAAAQSQDDLTIPVEPNGFYWLLGAGRFPNGQTLNGMSGSGSPLAFVHNDPGSYGQKGFRSWTKDLGLTQAHATLSGLALTLRNGGAVVFDNNGIETAATAGYYDNRGGSPDENKPGLLLFASMSVNLRSIFAGSFRLTTRTTFDQIVGYFDGNGNTELRFDPENIYNTYRMNMWSNRGDMPADPAGFVGDVLSSDRTPGSFATSDTGVRRVFRDGTTDPIFRVVYTLQRPATLEPGDYWFGHDVATPETGGASDSKQMQRGARRVRPDTPMRISR